MERKQAVLPPLQRPSRDLALAYATRMFLAGERVDLNAISTALGTGRTTLYRWLGDRDQVLSQVLIRSAQDVWDAAERQATGFDLERALSVGTAFITQISGVQPLQVFLQQEPQAALRVLICSDCATLDWVRRQACRSLLAGRENDPTATTAIGDALTSAAALVWPAVAIGDTPNMERIVRVLGLLLAPVFAEPSGLEKEGEADRGRSRRAHGQ